jgi:hypothetical protein
MSNNENLQIRIKTQDFELLFMEQWIKLLRVFTAMCLKLDHRAPKFKMEWLMEVFYQISTQFHKMNWKNDWLYLKWLWKSFTPEIKSWSKGSKKSRSWQKTNDFILKMGSLKMEKRRIKRKMRYLNLAAKTAQNIKNEKLN